MLLKSFRRIIGALTLALIAGGMLAPNAHAQKGGTGVFNDEVTWPTVFNLGFGGAANDNWQGSGTYSVGDGPTYSQSAGLANPEFHINFEIPIAKNMMFAPRITYNDYSLHWNNADPNPVFNGLTGGSFGAGDPNALVISHLDIGADLLFKYSFSNLHAMLGANLSTPLRYRFAHSNAIEDARDGSDIPDPAKFIAGLKGGIGYDIPLNMKHTIWLAPEAFFTYSVTDYVQGPNPPGWELFPVTLSGGASLKFALPGAAAPPPPMAELGATITARGVLPDGTLTAEPVVPQQALHTRVSMPLLPYIFFDNMESSIPARYTRMGSTGFSMQMLANKDAMDANHAVLDIVGQRLKDNPAADLRIVGTNSNSGSERNNINLSRARAMAARDYLVSTWGVDAGRVTIDQRNLPEIPTNPATQAGITENRRVEFSSNNPDVTGPVKIENREAVSVGQTVIRYETTVTPADWPWASWSISIDNNGQPIAPLTGSATLSGTGAPPAVQTMTLADASRWIDQPLHYKLTATDNTGRTVTADGYTRIVNKTVDRDNLERFAMLSFDFDKADINQRARQMLQLISESISRDATGVRIDGFCDATGTPQYNQTLSEERANSAVAALRAMSTLPANVTVAGHGLRDPRFTNDLPEGRQLNRRVEFTIEKSTR